MGLLFREFLSLSSSARNPFFSFLALFHLVAGPFQSALSPPLSTFFSMADKYAAFFIALVTSRHIVPVYPPPPLATLAATNPAAVRAADGRGAEPHPPSIYINLASSRTYTRANLARYIEGMAGVIFFPNPSPHPPLDFAFPRSMFPFCFVLINSSVMCLQDETRSVSQDRNKESRLSSAQGPSRGFVGPSAIPAFGNFRLPFRFIFFFHFSPANLSPYDSWLYKYWEGRRGEVSRVIARSNDAFASSNFERDSGNFWTVLSDVGQMFDGRGKFFNRFAWTRETRARECLLRGLFTRDDAYAHGLLRAR